MEKWIEESLSAFIKKYEKTVKKNSGKICYTTDKEGNFDDRSSDEKIGWWTNGFWPGLLWQLYSASGNSLFKDEAIGLEAKFDRIFLNPDCMDHDNGFRFLPSAVAHYRVEANEKSKKRGILAAENLAGRFCPTGSFIRAWNAWGGEDHIGWAIIDCMMNLPLLYWASEETKDPRFRDIAILHANTALENFIRPDGSVVHICCFDSKTGQLERTLGGQGYCEGSSWTRGQAWAIYGFALSYIHTGDEKYLNAAKRVANYFIANTPQTGLIPVDFRQPEEPNVEDSSAATIASCGMIEIAKHSEGRDKELYLNAAKRMLKALHEERNDYSDSRDNIVTRSTEAYGNKASWEIAIIYADYYYLEALLKLTGKELFIW